MRTSDFWPGDLFAEPNGPPAPNHDPVFMPSSARPKKASGMASGERATRDEEEGDEQERNAGALPQDQGKRLRIGRCEQARAKDEDEKSRKTGKKRWHWTKV